MKLARKCDGTDLLSGWYSQIFHAADVREFSPTLADVHTDPGGVAPPRDPSILRVGTGRPRLMMMTRETCAGPRAYAGIVFSYFEHLAPNDDRLDDEAWERRLESAPPAEVPWLARTQPVAAP